ncbi:hypothetical protein V2J09_010328 [Rumex salicifolius]
MAQRLKQPPIISRLLIILRNEDSETPKKCLQSDPVIIIQGIVSEESIIETLSLFVLSSAMRESEMLDLSDDADYAAVQQQGLPGITRSDSSTISEPEGAEVIFVKENVSVHPTQYMSERIRGRLKLSKQGEDLFMSWIPYKGQKSNTRLSEKDRSLYTIRPLPVSDVRSIRRHNPTFGWQYVIIVLSSGLAFPPLYFYNGGVKEFLVTIKLHVSLIRSAEDANIYIVNDFQDPLQKTLSSLELPRVSFLSLPSTSFSVAEPHLAESQESLDENTHSASSSIARPRPKAHDPARDLSIQILEKFSLVTRLARETTSQLFGEGNNDNFITIGRRKYNEYLLNDPTTLVPNDNDVESPEKSSDDLQEASKADPVPDDPLEFEKLSWGKPRQPPLAHEEWATFLDSEGRVMAPKELKKRIFYGGVSHELRKEVWPFLLGYYEYDSTIAEREYLRLMKKQEFETIKHQWQNISAQQAKRFTKFRERKGLIEKDVVRTDRSLPFYEGENNPNVNLLHDVLLTYSFYNFDLGYCQGMSDLLSPILYIMEDESEAFWCFTALMERLGPNFNSDQNGMHSQLFAMSKLVELLDGPLHSYLEKKDCLNYFFCFRWLEFEDTMRMWEVLWTHHLSEHLHLYVCVAILKRHRRKIIGERMDFDTLLKFINELSGHIDIESMLTDAEALCICAGDNGPPCIPPGTPPSLPLDNGLMYSQLEDEVL